MGKYEREITRAKWDLIEANYEGEMDAWQFGEYVEDSAREIAVYFDLPYLPVKEDLDYAYLRQVRSMDDTLAGIRTARAKGLIDKLRKKK